MKTTIRKQLSLCLMAILVTAFAAQAAPPPNILFILVDDQRHDSLGCAGHPILQTPNIDNLAEQGVRFENAFVSTSICMASRACIFTGLTETGHGYTGGGFPATPVIEPDVDTSFPVLLKQAGYRTGFFGKQHVKFEEGTTEALARMFDSCETIGRHPYFKKQEDGSERHSAELIGDRSVEFVEQQSADQPFCLYMSFNISHAEDGDKRPGIGHYPWPKAVDGLYEDIVPAAPRLGDPKYFEALPKFMQESMNRDRWFWRWDTPEKYIINMRAYLRMLTGMDRIVGRVLQTLEEKGLADNTVVIYTADNGYYMGDRGFAGKWSHFEQSLRVPLIIHDPRLPENKRNRVESVPVLNIDLPATMLELAGIDVPEKYQGRSALPVFNGNTPEDWRTDHFHEHHMNNASIPKWRGVRDERYSYARYFEQQPVYEFLHDLEADPDQIKNFADDPEYKEVLEKLRARCDELTAQYTRPEIVVFKESEHAKTTSKKK
jgi:arylsulfatase A-like enzyme